MFYYGKGINITFSCAYKTKSCLEELLFLLFLHNELVFLYVASSLTFFFFLKKKIFPPLQFDGLRALLMS